MNLQKRIFSLYIHIPFCAGKCDYCGFYSVDINAGNEKLLERFLACLCADIKEQISFFEADEITSVYIGGGNPCLLGGRIKILFDALKMSLPSCPLEFTVEANPECLTEEFLRLCLENKVNRLSLGVQSFNEKSRRAVNRRGNEKNLHEKLELASHFFGGRLNIDLITGFPFQDKKVIFDDLSKALKYNPVHLCVYSLTPEKGTVLYDKIKGKAVSLPAPEEADDLWLYAKDILLGKGFEHYEVSNFAFQGNRCLHNTRYWKMQNWLGAGPGASGTVIDDEKPEAKRFSYRSDVNAYLKNCRIKSAVCEELDRLALLKETLMMGYRLCEGPDRDLFKKRFGIELENCIPTALSKWKDKDKMLFLNSFLNDAFNELSSAS